MKIVAKFAIFASLLVASKAEEEQWQLGFLQQQGLSAAAKSESAQEAGQPVGGEAGGVVPDPDSVNTKWKDESDMSKPLQWTLAGLWVGMLTAIPFAISLIDGRPPTRSQKVVASLMLFVLFGGFYLFTNIILFQSIHFKSIRSLTTVECIYFMAQVITTVGYGDITPAKVRGQVFVGLYVIGALFVIAMLISDLTNVLVDRAGDYRQKLAAARAEQRRLEQNAEEDPPRSPSARKETSRAIEEAMVRQKKPSVEPLLIALSIFAVFDLCWVLFFGLHPGEGKDLFQAFYMSVITLSSVGLGYFTPITEHGMVFGAFWMLFGCGALANVITKFCELMVALNEWERHGTLKPESAKNMYNMLKNDVLEGEREEITQLEFLKFRLLQTKRVDKNELADIRRAFQGLNPKGGSVSLQSIRESLGIEEEEKEKQPAAQAETK